jgi:hypothetical protein
MPVFPSEFRDLFGVNFTYLLNRQVCYFMLLSFMAASDLNVRYLCLAAASYTRTGNFKFPYGPIKLSAHGSRSISEEFGGGKEGKLVMIKLAQNLTHGPY